MCASSTDLTSPKSSLCLAGKRRGDSRVSVIFSSSTRREDGSHTPGTTKTTALPCAGPFPGKGSSLPWEAVPGFPGRGSSPAPQHWRVSFVLSPVFPGSTGKENQGFRRMPPFAVKDCALLVRMSGLPPGDQSPGTPGARRRLQRKRPVPSFLRIAAPPRVRPPRLPERFRGLGKMVPDGPGSCGASGDSRPLYREISR